MSAKKKVWNGSAALRRFLVPIDSLEPFKGNPRRGDIEAIRASLRRFGQTKPITTYDGTKIVAGHHVTLAATEEDWTHIAAIEHEFASPAEARAFLLADNRIHDLGRYEDDALLAQLRAASNESLEGTGYTPEYVAELDAQMKKAFAPVDDPAPRLDERNPPEPPTDPLGAQVPIYPGEHRRDFAQHVKILEREWEVRGVSAVVLRAVREAALAANQT